MKHERKNSSTSVGRRNYQISGMLGFGKNFRSGANRARRGTTSPLGQLAASRTLSGGSGRSTCGGSTSSLTRDSRCGKSKFFIWGVVTKV